MKHIPMHLKKISKASYFLPSIEAKPAGCRGPAGCRNVVGLEERIRSEFAMS